MKRIRQMDLALGAKQPRERVVLAAEPAGQQQPPLAREAEYSPHFDIHAARTPDGLGGGGLWLFAEQQPCNPHRVTSDVVQGTAGELARIPDVLRPGKPEV